VIAAALIGGMSAGTAVAASPAPTACASLSRLVDAAPAAGPLFLASYPTVQAGPLHATAFLYDNAAAVIALIGCGQRDKAQRIGDAILVALDNDRYWHDGRLRNGYAAGTVEARPVKLAGWWDDSQQRWLEDRYQVGSDNGNMAWAMLALLALDRDGPQYRAGAERIGRWVLSSRDERGPGGFIGGSFGHEPTPAVFTWKSTEHNTDLAAAFRRLAEVTGKAEWRAQGQTAERFVRAMWTPACNCFATGTAEDGVTPNPTLALDAQIWPLLALPDAAVQYASVISTVEHRLTFGGGFAYGEPADGMWTEGTAQVALLAKLLGRSQQASALTAVIAAQQAPEGGYYATSTQSLPTGFMLPTDPSKPRLYYRLPHLGAMAWAALAERGFNPFTGSATLP